MLFFAVIRWSQRFPILIRDAIIGYFEILNFQYFWFFHHGKCHHNYPKSMINRISKYQYTDRPGKMGNLWKGLFSVWVSNDLELDFHAGTGVYASSSGINQVGPIQKLEIPYYPISCIYQSRILNFPSWKMSSWLSKIQHYANFKIPIHRSTG